MPRATLPGNPALPEMVPSPTLEEEEREAIRKVVHREMFEPLDCHGNPRGISDRSKKFTCELQRILHCGVGMSNAWIDPSGKLYLCCKMQTWKYDLLKSSVREAWQKAKEFVDRFSEADYAEHQVTLETLKRSKIEIKKSGTVLIFDK